MAELFAQPRDLSVIRAGLFEVKTLRPVCAEDIRQYRSAHNLRDAVQADLQLVLMVKREFDAITAQKPAVTCLVSLMYLPPLIVLGESEEVSGIPQYYQLVDKMVRLTRKNRSGWPADTHFLFCRF